MGQEGEHLQRAEPDQSGAAGPLEVPMAQPDPDERERQREEVADVAALQEVAERPDEPGELQGGRAPLSLRTRKAYPTPNPSTPRTRKTRPAASIGSTNASSAMPAGAARFGTGTGSSA